MYSKRVKVNCILFLILLALMGLQAVYFFLIQPKSPTRVSFCRELKEISSGKRSFRTKIRGEVLSRPTRPRPGELRMLMQAQVEDVSSSLHIRLSVPDVPWSEFANLRAGDQVEGEVRFRATACDEQALLDLSSYQSYLYRRGLYGTAALLSGMPVAAATTREAVSPPRSWRTELIERLFMAHGERESLAAILAVTLGERDLLSSSLHDLFRETGTAHLLVVSGFHVGVVYAMLYWILFQCLRQSIRVINFCPLPCLVPLLAFAGSLFYVFLIGGGIPAIRALLILAVFVVGKVLGRKSLPERNLLLAALLILLVWPGAFLEAGFQLTFSALSGLLVASHAVRRGADKSLHWFRHFLSQAWSSFLFCFFAWLFTAPVVLLWFGNIVPLSPIINFLFVPLFSFVCILGGGGGVILSLLFGEFVSPLFAAVLFGVECLFFCLTFFRDLGTNTWLGFQRVSEEMEQTASWGIFGLLLFFLFLVYGWSQIKMVLYEKRLGEELKVCAEKKGFECLFEHSRG